MKKSKTKSSKNKTKKISKRLVSKKTISKKTSSNRRSLSKKSGPLPKLESSFVHTKITKGSDGQYHVEGFILDQSIIKVKNEKPLTNYQDAEFIANVTRDAILTAYDHQRHQQKGIENKTNPFRKRNPQNQIDLKDENDQFGLHSFRSGTQAAIGMPSNPFDAYELGRMVGLRDGLENYCPLPWYNFKDNKIKKNMLATINNIVTNGFHEMSKRVVLQREGSRFVAQMPKQQQVSGGKNQKGQQSGVRAPIDVGGMTFGTT